MGKADDLSNSVIFPKGIKIESENFIGTAWLQWLPARKCAWLPPRNVTFEPGARNSWHKHPGGQILLVTGGRGYYQEDDKPAQELRPGDVVEIQDGRKKNSSYATI